MSDTLSVYQKQGALLAQGSVDATGKLAWTNAFDPTQCVALQLSVQGLNAWISLDPGTMQLNSDGFPSSFSISTPFGLLYQATLTFSSGNWTFEGYMQTAKGFGGFSFQTDSAGPFSPPSTDLYPQSAPFQSSPSNFSVYIPAVGSAPLVTMGFVQTEEVGNWTVYLSTGGVELGGTIWEPFTRTGDQFTLTYSCLLENPGPNLAVVLPYLEISGFETSLLFGIWNDSIAGPYQSAVCIAEPDAPISALWTFTGNAGDWSYRSFFSIYPPLTPGATATVTWQPGCFTLSGSAPFPVLMPDLLIHSSDAFQGSATLVPAIPDYDNTIESLVSQQVYKAGGYTVVFFAFRVSSFQASGVPSVRLGALDLTFPSLIGINYQIPDAPWHVLGYLEPNQNLKTPKVSYPRVFIQNLSIPVDVQVGSEDALPDPIEGVTIDSPIVVLASPSSVTAVPPPPYVLTISEQNPVGNPRLITLALTQSGLVSGTAAGNNVSLLILDRTPFLVGRVILPTLLGTASNGILAQWTNAAADGPVWLTQSGAQPVTLYLPPQGVGEQMERRQNDIPAGTAPIDYRFSPGAQLQIAPPVLAGDEVAFFEAPWNLRRLFISPDQDVPGPFLQSLSAELLYGMPVNIQSSALRLAEISALTGRLAGVVPDPPENSAAYTQYQDGWLQTLNAFQTRLAALLPWDGQDPTSLTLTDEAQYSLRSTADLAYPPLGSPAYPPNPPYPNPGPVTGHLKGGLAWIFEDEGVYREIWLQPQSTTALLADPALSALGGWAKQRAVFVNGLVTINCHVEMGRVSTISLELLGRIGVLWNQAKLVTVYERTVQAAPQFVGEQDPLLGQPIVRKVQEYVEILEPIRAYPESGQGAINVAFVQGSEFKSKIIYVDSAWGSDVANGMTVPLWNQSADPTIYPKPHIILNNSVDPDTGSQSQGQEIDEPDKLVFYAPTGSAASTLGPDPDRWPAALNVDFADVNLSANQGYRLAINPGFGNFTWALRPGALPTNVVAQRTSSAMSAALSNVTMMRSQPAPTAGTPPVLANLKAVPDHVVSIFQEMSDGWQNTVTATVNNLGLTQYFGDLAAAAGSAFSNVTASIQPILNASLANFDSLTSSAAAILYDAQQTMIQAVATGIDATAKKQAQAAAALLDSPIANLQFNTQAFSNVFANLTTVLTTLYNKVQPLVTNPPQVTDSGLLTTLLGVHTVVVQNVKTLTDGMSLFRALTGTLTSPGWANLGTLESRLAGPIGDLISVSPLTQTDLDTAVSCLNSDIAALQQAVTALQNSQLGLTLDPISPPLINVTTVQQAQAWLAGLGPSTDSLQKAAAGAIATAQGKLTAWIIDPHNLGFFVPANLQSFLTTAGGTLQNVLLAREAALGNLAPQLSDLQNQVQGTMSAFLEAGKLFTGDPTSAAYAVGSQALSLLRAYGAPPVAPGLNFTLPNVPAFTGLPGSDYLQNLAYFYGSQLADVPITSAVQSVLTEAAQAVAGLSPVGISVPIQSVLDRLVPDTSAIEQQALSIAGDLGKGIFQNLAGMDLSSLFSGILPPLNTPDGIQISHSINPQTKQVEVQANIDVQFASDVTVFNEGPILLQLLKARFQATIMFRATAGQPPVEQITGNISGDWEVQIAGMSLITFVQTSLTFDQNGHISFNVSADKIRLASVMQFIADLINSIVPAGSGLSVSFSSNPVAAIANLDLPLPDIAGGVFALSNIRLGALFSLGLDDAGSFQFVVGMNLSRMDAPFAIVVFILGGGGWIETQLTYTLGGSISVTAEIGISAVASLEIALGPISGGVMISFSLFASYSTGSSLELGIVIVIAGHVSLLDIVDADITLLLEAYYSSGTGALVGRGSVSVDIQICWCFTLSIHQEVEYTFGNAGSGGSSAAALTTSGPDSYYQSAGQYVDMLAA